MPYVTLGDWYQDIVTAAQKVQDVAAAVHRVGATVSDVAAGRKKVAITDPYSLAVPIPGQPFAAPVPMWVVGALLLGLVMLARRR